VPGGLPFAAGATVAVSLEPAGGSPTGQPTGPVVTTATVLQAG
jgi:anti-sigma-K factor RskA